MLSQRTRWPWVLALLHVSLAVVTCAAEDARINYGEPKQLGKLANTAINESSGVAVSRRRKDVFWTHNDSGDKPRIYAFDRAGKDLGTYQIKGALAWDWEDMASFTKGEKSYLLLADVGDNARLRPLYWLYLVEEPTEREQDARLVRTVRFKYEDGPHNCESVAFDTTSDQVILITKTGNEQCQVFALDWSKEDTDEPHVAKCIATIKLSRTTAMDISPDGRRAIVLTYGPAYEYTRGDGEDWTKTFSRPINLRIPFPGMRATGSGRRRSRHTPYPARPSLRQRFIRLISITMGT